VVEEHSMADEVHAVKRDGGHGRENVGISSKNQGENP
jgi:hypothetical protein